MEADAKAAQSAAEAALGNHIAIEAGMIVSQTCIAATNSPSNPACTIIQAQ